MAWLVGTEAVANVFLHGDLKLNPLLPLWPHILCPRPSWSGGDPAYLTNGDSLPEQAKCTLGQILCLLPSHSVLLKGPPCAPLL